MWGVILRLLGVALTATSVAGYAKIREQDLTVLTLHQGKYTTARRTSPIPQLNCLSNCKHAPLNVQCKATGWDGEKMHWKCDAVLPDGVFFGTADVSCEGYDYPGDPYITAGSCGLSYSLTGKSSGREGVSGNMTLTLIGFVFAGLLVIWCCSKKDASNAYDRQSFDDDDSNHRSNFYGGSKGFGDNTTPGFRPNYNPPPSASCGRSAGGFQQEPQNGAGFWSGLAAGGLAGYMFGRNNTYDAYGYGGNYDYMRSRDYSTGTSGFFGRASGSSEGTSRRASGSRSTSAFASTSRR